MHILWIIKRLLNSYKDDLSLCPWRKMVGGDGLRSREVRSEKCLLARACLMRLCVHATLII